MEYAKTGNLHIAEQFFNHASSICSFDPLAFNEIGVVRYLQQDYEEVCMCVLLLLCKNVCACKVYMCVCVYTIHVCVSVYARVVV